MSNQSKYNLAFMEGLIFQSFHCPIQHVGSLPIITILSHGGLLTAGEANGNPTTPAFIPGELLFWKPHFVSKRDEVTRELRKIHNEEELMIHTAHPILCG